MTKEEKIDLENYISRKVGYKYVILDDCEKVPIFNDGKWSFESNIKESVEVANVEIEADGDRTTEVDKDTILSLIEKL